MAKKLTMAEKRKLAAKRKAAKAKSGFAESVFVSAMFKRATTKDAYGDVVVDVAYPGKDDVEYNYTVRELHPDKHGNLIANAGCDDTLVCTREELPGLIAFLQKLVPANVTATA